MRYFNRQIKKEYFFDNYSEFIKKSSVSEHVIKIFKNFRVSANLNSLEILQKVYIHNHEFSVDNGLLTPKLKLKLVQAKQYFLEQIKKMYGGAVFQGE